MISDPSQVRQLPGGGPKAYTNDNGKAHVLITKGAVSISANFSPQELYVFFDPYTALGGFGSASGGRAYLVVLTSDYPGDDDRLVTAVSDIATNPGDSIY